MLFPRHCLSTAAACHSPVRVRLLPSPKCLFDEPVQVKVEGLSPNKEVVLRAKLTDEKGELFQSSASYRADGIGEIDLSRSPALGGSFSGTDPMGLFWALSAKNAHKGSLPWGAGHVRDGGGLPEYRASLLASRGFAVLALAYYSYLDLPKDMRELELEYFEEAVSFLRTHPQVKGPGIGVLAISKSGDLALSMASFLPGISATVSINGCNANTLFPLRYKGTVVPPLSFKTSRLFLTKSGIANIRDTLNNPTEGENRQSVIPIEQAQCRFLFVVAEDDQNWKSPFYAEEAAKRLREHGKENCEVVVYPGASLLPLLPLFAAFTGWFASGLGRGTQEPRGGAGGPVGQDTGIFYKAP
ncbi:UNVERIFIED_CONTAM: hypothetical protein FKN15_007086 [Acipenser sinensis]